MWIFQKPDRKMFLSWKGYLFGTALVAIATGIKYIAQPDIITSANSLPYILAIVATAIFWGLGPSIFVSIISVLVYLYVFRAPAFGVTSLRTSDIITLIIFLITGVIISFLASNLRHKTNEASESEEKYRKVVDNANEVIAIVQDGVIKFFGGKALDLTGYSPNDLVSKSFLVVVHPDDRDRAVETYEKIIKYESTSSASEFRVLRKDGDVRWAQLNAANLTWENRPAVLAIFTDISDRKNMEQELKVYAQKITQVQEEERKRIAYELHDDTAQYLSILKMELDSLIHSGQIQDPKILEKLQFLEKDAGRAFDDVRRSSHELRPGVLEHLGLQAAIEQMADDINKLNQIPVKVNIQGSEPPISEDIKLGFFRIAQEALNNARKHSKATEVIINLKYLENLIQMTVQDNGAGFDIQKVKSESQASLRGSMGLTSMQERAKLIGADLKIESKLNQGTSVIVVKTLG